MNSPLDPPQFSLDWWKSLDTFTCNSNTVSFVYEETENLDAPMNSCEEITKVCDGVRDLLLEKNRKYGDSALDPVRIFSKADPAEQIRVRLDDKLSRLRSGQNDEDEDVIDDLLGYLILYKIALSRQKVAKQ